MYTRSYLKNNEYGVLDKKNVFIYFCFIVLNSGINEKILYLYKKKKLVVPNYWQQ